MEASKEENGHVMGARFDNIMKVSVWYTNCAVDVGAVGEVINLNRRDTNGCTVQSGCG